MKEARTGSRFRTALLSHQPASSPAPRPVNSAILDKFSGLSGLLFLTYKMGVIT